MPYVVAEPCVDVMDRSCLEECPVDCIYEGDRKMYINPKECIDCGACAPACPMTAIFSDATIPESQAHHREDNRIFFTGLLRGRDAPLGTPGGAGTLGPVGVDTPIVAALG